MNILIINAFGSSPAAKAKYNAFCSLIKQTLKKISKHSGIDSFSFTYKDPTNIDEFIYDPDFNPNEGTKTNINNKKNFDKIDMVFIDGCEKYLPWERIGYKLSFLLRLCKTCNKILYAGGVALEILVYYLATGSHNELNFINAKGEIQSIEEIHLIPSEFLGEIKKNDHFLDFVTGDVLEYRSISKTWESIVNIGLHKQIVAEKYMSRGKFVLPNHYVEKYYNDKTIVSNCKELKITITRPFLSHWLVKGVPNEFVSYTSLTWFPHYFNVSYEKYQFQTICESSKGPVVIEHGDSIGVAFHANLQYKETALMLENFIKQKFKNLHERLYHLSLENQGVSLEKFLDDPSKLKKEKDVPLMFKSYKLNDETKLLELKDKYKKKSLRPLSYIEKINCSRPFNKVLKVKKDAAHCGFSFNNRNMIFVEDNSINQRAISCYGVDYINLPEKDSTSHKQNHFETVPNEDIDQITKTTFEETIGYDFSDKNALKPNENARISTLFKEDEQELDTITLSPSTKTHKKQLSSMSVKLNKNGSLMSSKLVKLKNEMNKHDQNAEDYIAFIDKEKMEEEQMISYYKHLRREICSKLNEINVAPDYKNKNKKRFIIHHKKKTRRLIGRNSLSNVGLNKISSHKSNLFLNNTDALSSISDNKHLYTSSGTQYVSLYPYIKQGSSSNEARVPIITEPSFPVTDEPRSNLEPHFYEAKSERKESDTKILKLNKNKRNFSNKLIKNLDKNNNTDSNWRLRKQFLPNRTMSTLDGSVKKYENPLSTYKYRDVTPNKWLSPNGFVV